MPTPFAPVLRRMALILCPLLLCRCATVSAHAPRAAAMQEPASPAPLARSLFARDPGGQLTEDALQRILASPLEMALPARVGVLPILPAADWHGPGPSYQQAPPGAGAFAAALRGTEPFSLVTETLAIPSGALGMEALREIAARYHLRYLLLYREEVQKDRLANGWAAGYVTLLGALFLPGQTLRAAGYVEASLFDCKTGLLVFTVRRPVAEQRWSTVWHQEDKLAQMQARLAIAAAPALAGEVRQATTRFAEAVRLERGAAPERGAGATPERGAGAAAEPSAAAAPASSDQQRSSTTGPPASEEPAAMAQGAWAAAARPDQRGAGRETRSQ